MKKSLFKRVGLLSMLILMFVMVACGSDKPRDLLVGIWVSEDDEIVDFQEDGSCTAPFTYVGAWLESAERYTVKEDGKLVMSSKEGHADDSFKLAESEEEALDNRNMYFVSKDTLIINGEAYSRSE